jgi:hypothetical protein
VAGVTELTRILAREGFLWCNQTQVSQQAISSRFLTFPAELTESYSLRDRLIILGSGTQGNCPIRVRLVEIRSGKTWHSYITSVLEPTILPPYVVADLYRKRWRIEQAFNTVKRLLGLSYLWTGSINGIKLQIWATWLFYAVLMDLGDAIADELALPVDRISLEMIYPA